MDFDFLDFEPAFLVFEAALVDFPLETAFLDLDFLDLDFFDFDAAFFPFGDLEAFLTDFLDFLFFLATDFGFLTSKSSGLYFWL